MNVFTQLAYREREVHDTALVLSNTFNEIASRLPKGSMKIRDFGNEPFNRFIAFEIAADNGDGGYRINLLHERAEIERDQGGCLIETHVVDLRGKGGEQACVAILAELAFQDPDFAAQLRQASDVDALLAQALDKTPRRAPMAQQSPVRRPSIG